MLASMTGFARHTIHAEWGQATLEIRSVNHRFLEITFKCPDWCRALEEAVKEKIKQSLLRGKVDLFLHVQANEHLQPPLELNEPLARKLNDMIRTVSGTMCGGVQINVMDVLKWPDLVRVGAWQIEGFEKPLLELLDTTLGSLVSARKREGAALAKILEDKSNLLLSLVERVKTQSYTRQGLVKEKLLKHLDELKQHAHPERLEQELVFYLHRLDVSEELERLNSHSQTILGLVKEGGAMGRRLDFLMQELNREANTLAAKSGDVLISELAVEIKVLIEQMREQVQNLE